MVKFWVAVIENFTENGQWPAAILSSETCPVDGICMVLKRQACLYRHMLLCRAQKKEKKHLRSSLSVVGCLPHEVSILLC